MNKLDLEKIRKFHNFLVSMIIVFLFIVFWSFAVLTMSYGNVNGIINSIVFTIFVFACVILPFYLLVVISERWWIKK